MGEINNFLVFWFSYFIIAFGLRCLCHIVITFSHVTGGKTVNSSVLDTTYIVLKLQLNTSQQTISRLLQIYGAICIVEP